MRNRTIETAATAIVVASLVFGMVVTMPTTPDYGDVELTTVTDRQFPTRAFGLPKQPERI